MNTYKSLKQAAADGRAAQQVRGEADWRTLDAAFAENRDPLTGHPPSHEYEQLFSRIVRTAPAPIGLGEA